MYSNIIKMAEGKKSHNFCNCLEELEENEMSTRLEGLEEEQEKMYNRLEELEEEKDEMYTWL